MRVPTFQALSPSHLSCCRYTKSLTPASASAQRYNPELARPGSALIASFESAFQEQAHLAQLGDQLRHVRQLVMSQLTELAVATSPESDSFVRGDEETEALEGSGASGVPGATPWSDDEDHHNGWAEGEGSGRGSGDEPLPVGKFTLRLRSVPYGSWFVSF